MTTPATPAAGDGLPKIIDDMTAVDKLDRVRNLILAMDMMSGAHSFHNEAISEFAWTLREKMDDALATLEAERAREGVA